jgi:hypothetical protein
MKAICLGIIVALAIVASAFPADPIGDLFPVITPWSVAVETAIYGPHNLFEYIDGAADNFLAYDFQELAVRVYEDAARHQLTAEVYRHASALNAFGVYSSEKPLKGEYLAIGAQGYYEQGVLNFCSGPYYVKLSAFDLGDKDRGALTSFAAEIARRIGAPAALPAELRYLPELDRQPESERFILRDFLGHPFLGSALVADYKSGTRSFKLFVLLNADEAAARDRMQRWAALDKSRPAGVPLTDELTLQDPYNGVVRLLRRGSFLAGGVKLDDSAWSVCRAEFVRLIPDLR